MAKNVEDTSFRQIDIDAYNEDAYKEDEDTESVCCGPDEAEVTSLLNSGRHLEALVAALKNPPYKSKVQSVRDRSVQLVMRVICSMKQDQMNSAVDALDKDQMCLLMKYIYKGFEFPQCNSSSTLLQWHRRLYCTSGSMSIIHTLVDGDRL